MFAKHVARLNGLRRTGYRQILAHAQTWAGHSIWLPASTTALLTLVASVAAGIASSATMPISTNCGQTLLIVRSDRETGWVSGRDCADGFMLCAPSLRSIPAPRARHVDRSSANVFSQGGNMSRVAVVTGGTRGIGAAISKALKVAGYQVAATYHGNDEAAAKFKAESGVQTYKWDVSSFEACSTGLAQVAKDLGPVDVLVNNAGITKDGMFHKMTPEQWYAVINTNLNSLFNMTRPVIDGMRERGFGRIINISSVNGQKGQMGQVNYSASKAGDLGFTKALAQENANKGITVNAICPGYIATEMVMAVPKDVLEKSILPQIAVRRLGQPEEIARCVVFLAADEAGFVTGATLSANGGQLMT
jgi:acetoacetyl-CoA reductase